MSWFRGTPKRRRAHAPSGVPRLGVSLRFLIGLVAVTVAAGAVDVWLSRRGIVAEPPRELPAASSAPSPLPIETTDPYLSTVAEAHVPTVHVFRNREGAKTWKTLDHPQPSGSPLVFLVKENEGDWLKVLLPLRPNGSTGWIRAREVSLTQHTYRIVIQLSQHRITVFDGAELVFRRPIGVGTQDAPTPGGEYYIKELLKPPNPNSVYGTYAYGLSGFSNVFKTFAGGEGVIGLHGTNDPSGIGKDVSHGCIRMHNKDIERLVKILPLGTPVTIIK